MQPDKDLAASTLEALSNAIGDAPSGRFIIVCAVVVAALLVTLWRSAATVRRQRHRIRALESQVHGATVRRGYATEALAPLLREFPVPVGKPGTSTLFVGQPVDYIHFDEHEGITFIEIKSGSSQLSQRQRRLRDLTERGAVQWATMTIDS